MRKPLLAPVTPVQPSRESSLETISTESKEEDRVPEEAPSNAEVVFMVLVSASILFFIIMLGCNFFR